ncbi:hypothetical protein DM02DRAFT_216180 [Periconia macrospinosa]|uniref:Uncharacterized protein n=1 Tax=Periconia macrospinosa TaxID=97972 RepID=A0A2V1D6L5_9PLEO|nr:hypothetical protein DM02DRAFT_216180 [Periconia macrospinosa]
MILDVNKRVNSESQSQLCYRIARGNPMNFEKTNYSDINRFSEMFSWGGRGE